jgi:nucleoside-diphosphate-sugar epimerase
MEAYWASKAFARLSTQKFIADNKPQFDIVNLLPSVVLGPEDLATGTSTLLVGTRAMLLPVLQGSKLEMPLVGTPVHVDDVARAHVDAIKSSIPGNADYVLSSDGEEGIEWDSMTDIARKYFPEEVKSGLLPLGGTLPTRKWRLDVSNTDRVFGWKCRSFDETMRDLIGQYVGFLKEEQS